MKNVERNYLEIRSLEDLSELPKPSNKLRIELVNPKDFQLNIDPNIKTELRISVSGVEEHNDLLNVEKIIETNVLVYAYSIGSISSDTVTYVLSIRGQVSDLEKLMNVNPLLTNQPSQDNAIDLEYFYQVER